MTSTVNTPRTPTTEVSSSALIAAEVRAEIARRGISAREFARQAGLEYMWLNRRIKPRPSKQLSIEDVQLLAQELDVPVSKLLLPWYDSNVQPSGYPSSQVSDTATHGSGLPLQVVMAGVEWELAA